MRKTILILLILFVKLNAQSVDVENILNDIKQKMGLVNDYTVDLEISVNMDFLKMPNSTGKLYFKKPDKMKFDSKKFSMLPKASLELNPQKILNYNFNSVLVVDTTLSKEELLLVKLNLENDSLEFDNVLMTIDTANNVIDKITYSDSSGINISTNIKYNNEIEFALPSEVIIDFTYADSDAKSSRRKNQIPEKISGIVKIKYSNYKINKGIDDNIFDSPTSK